MTAASTMYIGCEAIFQSRLNAMPVDILKQTKAIPPSKALPSLFLFAEGTGAFVGYSVL